VSPELREWMGAAAVAAAEAVAYRGAGTCEFLLAPDRSFYFLEMNTRIQVEHPVTELVYGVDLVREQLRIAAGEPMRIHDGWLNPRGWALECRITSEDPSNGFLPSTGRIEHLRVPGGPGVRWDGGVEVGDAVTLYYDSMLAKLIVWAPDREQAVTRMRRALVDLVIGGIESSRDFHIRVMDDDEFRRGAIDIQWLERRLSEILARSPADETTKIAAIAGALLAERDRTARAVSASSDTVAAPDRAPALESWNQAGRIEGLRT